MSTFWIIGFVVVVNRVFCEQNAWQPGSMPIFSVSDNSKPIVLERDNLGPIFSVSDNSKPTVSISDIASKNKETHMTPFQSLGKLPPTPPRLEMQMENSVNMIPQVEPQMRMITPVEINTPGQPAMLGFNIQQVFHPPGMNIPGSLPSVHGVQNAMSLDSNIVFNINQIQPMFNAISPVIKTGDNILDTGNNLNQVGYATVLETRTVPVVTMKKEPVVRMRQVVSKVPVVRMANQEVVLPDKF